MCQETFIGRHQWRPLPKKLKNELSQCEAMTKQQKQEKRKRTSNTTRGNNGIGMCVGLQEYNEIAATQDNVKQIEIVIRHDKAISFALTDISFYFFDNDFSSIKKSVLDLCRPHRIRFTKKMCCRKTIEASTYIIKHICMCKIF